MFLLFFSLNEFAKFRYLIKSMHSGVQYHIQINIWHAKLLKLRFISAHTKGLSKYMLYSSVLPIEKNHKISYGTET